MAEGHAIINTIAILIDKSRWRFLLLFLRLSNRIAPQRCGHQKYGN
jgi:hypothetical protein